MLQSSSDDKTLDAPTEHWEKLPLSPTTFLSQNSVNPGTFLSLFLDLSLSHTHAHARTHTHARAHTPDGAQKNLFLFPLVVHQQPGLGIRASDWLKPGHVILTQGRRPLDFNSVWRGRNRNIGFPPIWYFKCCWRR